jgi:hypothetical protein
VTTNNRKFKHDDSPLFELPNKSSIPTNAIHQRITRKGIEPPAPGRKPEVSDSVDSKTIGLFVIPDAKVISGDTDVNMETDDEQ